MKLLIIALFLLTFSCTPNKVSSSFLQVVKELGSKNNGITKIVYQNKDLYVISFANGSKHGALHVDESDKHFVDILGSEINSCENMCKLNGGLNDLEVRRDCLDSVTVNMNSLCRRYENKVKCVCKNQIYQTLARSIILSEKEIQTRTKELQAIIWIAPQ
jgi:hypothetical protein